MYYRFPFGIDIARYCSHHQTYARLVFAFLYVGESAGRSARKYCSNDGFLEDDGKGGRCADIDGERKRADQTPGTGPSEKR